MKVLAPGCGITIFIIQTLWVDKQFFFVRPLFALLKRNPTALRELIWKKHGTIICMQPDEAFWVLMAINYTPGKKMECICRLTHTHTQRRKQFGLFSNKKRCRENWLVVFTRADCWLPGCHSCCDDEMRQLPPSQRLPVLHLTHIFAAFTALWLRNSCKSSAFSLFPGTLTD
jgi:hypothetical protein